MISIIMPAYNAEQYIRNAIESIISQTYQDWELLIIDDNSSDNTLKIIDSYASDSRIRIFENTSNLGPAKARNLGLENAKGEYIAFLDADDFLHREKFESQLKFMQDNRLEMSHGNYCFCDDSGKISKKVYVSEKIDYFTLLKGNQFKIMTPLIVRNKIMDLRFPEVRHEDYAFYLDCLKRIPYSLAQVERLDSFVRVGHASVSSNKIKSAIWTWDIYYKYEKLGLLKSLYYFICYAYNGFVKHKII
ncbi:glycosyltransferase family 2 protein [Bisgaard Taxon 10/6]|uniref:glycosyltransferase family 2 protein n=1 Tax=Exercitatus varius TaxID=67857 RepID=UPI00294AD05F|nr:glycosyltransferase family 2 protein [Exercitatus varius]MDG2960984.1 glycosyltransferase family 2 protein [Exercitatus varius]